MHPSDHLHGAHRELLKLAKAYPDIDIERLTQEVKTAQYEIEHLEDHHNQKFENERATIEMICSALDCDPMDDDDEVIVARAEHMTRIAEVALEIIRHLDGDAGAMDARTVAWELRDALRSAGYYVSLVA